MRILRNPFLEDQNVSCLVLCDHALTLPLCHSISSLLPAGSTEELYDYAIEGDSLPPWQQNHA